jgi:hypothetical protein
MRHPLKPTPEPDPVHTAIACFLSDCAKLVVGMSLAPAVVLAGPSVARMLGWL